MKLMLLIRIKKRKKRREVKGNDESATRLCDLPDPILQLIISSLPTKYAIRTGVLSKRWLHLWKCLSEIELHEYPKDGFKDFVSSLLICCDCSNLKKFFLSCVVGEDASLVSEWLHGFINPKIQELDLSLFETDKPVVFPEYLFTCATLTKFQLSMEHIFELPSSIRFECLRSLTLRFVIFTDSSSVQRLFSGCPSLEELALHECDWVNVGAVCICSPVLQKLEIRESWLKETEHDDSNCELVIIGTNLKSFSYEGHHVNEYFLFGSTSVIDASVQLHAPVCWWGDGWEIDFGHFVLDLLQALKNAEKLSFSKLSLEAICREVSLLFDLPRFCNLVELCVVWEDPMELSCFGLMAILHNSPCLEVLNFECALYLPEDFPRYIFNGLPRCLNNLKTITIDGFKGDEVELRAIKFLLQVTSALETLHIRSYACHFDNYLTGSNRSKECYKKIARFPKGSRDCEIDLQYGH